jgi:hypothetical protein
LIVLLCSKLWMVHIVIGYVLYVLYTVGYMFIVVFGMINLTYVYPVVCVSILNHYRTMCCM